MIYGAKIKLLGNLILQSYSKSEELTDGLTVFGNDVGHLCPQFDFVESFFADDIGLSVVEAIEVVLLEVGFEFIGGVVDEIRLLYQAIVILVHGVTIDFRKEQIFINLQLKLRQILALDDFDGAQIRIMRNLLVAESILHNSIPIPDVLGGFLLDDVAAHVEDLFLCAFKVHHVLNGTLTPIE